MNTVNLSIEYFEEYFSNIAEIVFNYRDKLEREPVIPPTGYSGLHEVFDEELPVLGASLEDLLSEVNEKVVPNCSKVGHPRFLAWMNNAGCDAGLLGELLNIGLNQNPFMFKGGPAATVIEDVVVGWMGKLFGFDGDCGGILTSGGTVANLTALLVARESQAGNTMQQGVACGKQPTLYVSEQGHTTIDRAVGILGLGIDHIRRVPVDKCFRMDSAILEKRIEQDLEEGFQPFCVVAQAGSASVGAVDPIDEIAAVCKKYKLWLHVDAAYGGAAILTESKKHLFRGIEQADSITVDPHKWFYISTEAGLVLFRNKEKQFNTFTATSCKAYKGNYDEINYLDYGLQLSRTSRAMKIWFAFKYYGLEKIGRCVEQNIRLANELTRRFENEPDWEVLNPVELSVVCLRYAPDRVNNPAEVDRLQAEILKKLEESGKAFLTGVLVNGKNGIRICFANHRTTLQDVEILHEILVSIAKEL